MHYTNIFIASLIFISISTNAQEFDKDFLSSLPDDIKEDLLEKNNKRLQLEEPVYRNLSTEIDKDVLANSKEIFGSNFFTTYQSTFMPLNEPNFDAGYILDYGDALKIQLIGQKNFEDIYKISRSGSINLPEIGIINIAGQTLNDASRLIHAKVKESYIGTEAFVSLENIRDINVMIAGNVFNPGVYTLSGNSNALQALVIAGGVNQQGSYREINLKRNNQTIETIDIYDYLIFGNSSVLTRLRSGDLIFVEKSKNIVSISGAVKRPTSYELKNNETLDDLVFFANGLRSDADMTNIFVDRLIDGSIERIKFNDIQDLKNFITYDSDSLNIGDFKLREVNVTGAVKNPGKYLIKEGDGILELIVRAGGYTSNAYPYAGILKNKNALSKSQEANEIIYNQLISKIIDLSSISQNNNDISSLISIATIIKNSSESGRVIAEFNIEKIKIDSKLNKVLHDGDEIIIPELINHIYIFGEVANQGTINFEEGLDISTYISAQGGLLDSADKKNIYVVLPNGKSLRVNNRNKIFMPQNNSNSIDIVPGSIIYVPRKINDSAIRQQTLQAYTSILSNLGVSLASLSVLKD